jgi:hypothetical protein
VELRDARPLPVEDKGQSGGARLTSIPKPVDDMWYSTIWTLQYNTIQIQYITCQIEPKSELQSVCDGLEKVPPCA